VGAHQSDRATCRCCTGRGGEEHVASELIDQARTGEALASVGSARGHGDPRGGGATCPELHLLPRRLRGMGKGRWCFRSRGDVSSWTTTTRRGEKNCFFFCKVPLQRKTVRSSIPHPAAKKVSVWGPHHADARARMVATRAADATPVTHAAGGLLTRMRNARDAFPHWRPAVDGLT
jgi:hypothetical protein